MTTTRKLWAEQTQLLAFIRASDTDVKIKDWKTQIRIIGRELMRQTT